MFISYEYVPVAQLSVKKTGEHLSPVDEQATSQDHIIFPKKF